MTTAQQPENAATRAAQPGTRPPLAQTDWSQIPSPAFLVDVARLDANVAAVADAFASAGVALRPHFKTSKCLPVARKQLAAGAAGFTVSTPAEVKLLAEEGMPNLLWAHQPVGPGKVETAVTYAGAGVLTVILDSVAVAEPISAAAQQAGVEVPYLVEVNTGQGRTGVEPDQVLAVVTELDKLPGLRMRGVMTHEGHVGTHTVRSELEQAARKVGDDLAEVATQVREAGFTCDVVSVGATPSMRSAPFEPGVTEGRPGTYVYYDANQVRLGSCELDQCASSVLARVVSVNRPGSAIIDAGSKAMSSDIFIPELGMGTPVDLEGNPLPGISFASANEEHGFLVGDGTAALKVGDMLRIIPNHACGTSNMWSSALAVYPDGHTERWDIGARH